MTLLHESQIFSPVECIAIYYKVNSLCIEQWENYQKRSFRNRYKILTANGVEILSIPLHKGKNNQMPIRDVKISYDEQWTAKHLQSIRSAYGKSAFFEFYYPEIEKLLAKKPVYLFDLNFSTTEYILKKMKINLDISLTIDFQKVPQQSDTNILDSNSYPLISPYPQVWSDRFEFVPGLCYLDLLFCVGPEAHHYLI